MSADPRTIVELAQALRAREVTAAEITERCLGAFLAQNP
jgi:Asp-tRNA(Asn)/Glu-tRNA(Gln) amidotransferase A subunit family amidase